MGPNLWRESHGPNPIHRVSSIAVVKAAETVLWVGCGSPSLSDSLGSTKKHHPKVDQFVMESNLGHGIIRMSKSNGTMMESSWYDYGIIRMINIWESQSAGWSVKSWTMLTSWLDQLRWPESTAETRVLRSRLSQGLQRPLTWSAWTIKWLSAALSLLFLVHVEKIYKLLEPIGSSWSSVCIKMTWNDNILCLCRTGSHRCCKPNSHDRVQRIVVVAPLTFQKLCSFSLCWKQKKLWDSSGPEKLSQPSPSWLVRFYKVGNQHLFKVPPHVSHNMEVSWNGGYPLNHTFIDGFSMS